MPAKVVVVCLCVFAVGEAVRNSYNPPTRGGFGSGRIGGAGAGAGGNRGNLGADCEYDDDCFMDNAFCHMQMQCQCKRNYEPNQSRDTCQAKIGADCRSRFDCSSLENSECRQNLCACQEGYIPFQDRSCLRLLERIGDPCEDDQQCKILGRNARCVTKRCQCDQYEHMADGKCYPNKGLRNPCENNNECWIGDGFKGMVQCRNGVCKCSEGYHETPERTCAGGDGATSLQISLFASIIPVLVSLTRYYKN